MALDHEAIYEAYKTATKPVVSIDDTAGAFAADGSKVTLSDAKIAAARKALDDAAALIKYKTDRTTDGSTVLCFFRRSVRYALRRIWLLAN